MNNNIIIINGPNVNMIGIRETNIYGNININKYLKFLKFKYKEIININIYNNNSESKIINYIYDNYYNQYTIGYILNLGAYTHTSLAISDCIRAIKNKIIIEVHVSNVFNRENIRHKSLISSYSNGIIVGFGLTGYELAIISIINQIKNKINK
ncbi:type II 3-dehydroquinate dehydratase [Candidatus Shikimatogenerans bostrichidophilus]|uniref:type II 3-dehydroquinate dehydratase n=1 Tax=Candidatus Shikimatogenerans bostrichidophilus TaxID=2943807 RepID=UPI002966D783